MACFEGNPRLINSQKCWQKLSAILRPCGSQIMRQRHSSLSDPKRTLYKTPIYYWGQRSDRSPARSIEYVRVSVYGRKISNLFLLVVAVLSLQVASLHERLVAGETVSETKVIAGQPHHFVLRGGDAQASAPLPPPPLPVFTPFRRFFFVCVYV